MWLTSNCTYLANGDHICAKDKKRIYTVEGFDSETTTSTNNTSDTKDAPSSSTNMCKPPAGMYIRVEFWESASKVFDNRKHTFNVPVATVPINDPCSLSSQLSSKISLKWNWLKIRLIDSKDNEMKGCQLNIKLLGDGNKSRKLQSASLAFSKSRSKIKSMLNDLVDAAKDGYNKIQVDIKLTSAQEAEQDREEAVQEANRIKEELKKADEAKKAAEAEAEKQAEIARQAKDQEEKVRAEVAKKEAETLARQKAEELQKAEEARKIAEQEAIKLEETRRREEENKRILEEELNRLREQERLRMEENERKLNRSRLVSNGRHTLHTGESLFSYNGCLEFLNASDGHLIVYRTGPSMCMALPLHEQAMPRACTALPMAIHQLHAVRLPYGKMYPNILGDWIFGTSSR